MKGKLLALLLAFAACGFVQADGTGIIHVTPDKMTLGFGASIDNEVKTGESPSIKLVCPSSKRVARAEMELPLDPDVTHYELSFYMKVENIVSEKPDAQGADIWLKPNKGGALRFSTRGTYKSETGTFDWKKASYKVDVKRYLKERPAKIIFMLNYASGTAWFDRITLTPVSAVTAQKVKSPEAYTFGIFPMCYQKSGEVYEIAENLPAQWSLKCLVRPKNPSGNQLTLELELPDFLSFAGIGGLISQSSGKYFPMQKFTESAGRPDCRKYTVAFDSLLSGLIKSDWRRNCMLVNAVPGSAGKSGFCYWTVRLDGRIVGQGREAISVGAPVKMTEAPCRRFRVGVFAPVSDFSAFRGGPENQAMTAFWHSLTEMPPFLFGSPQNGPRDRFARVLSIGGFQLEAYLGLPEYDALKKAAPPKTGRVVIPSWYLLDDPDGLVAAYETALYAKLRELFPGVKDIFLNVEPYLEHGYDPAGRERFARVMKLNAVPDEAACRGALRAQWEAYMLDVHRQLIAKIAARMHKEGYRLLLCSNKVDSRFGPGTWTSGVDAIDAAKYADEMLIMGYAIGTKFFDDVALNVKHLGKPVFPGQDPAEEYRAWFDIYTPAGVRQNVVAAAALGCVGLWYYPTDMMSGKYLRAITEGYSMVSKYEDFYVFGTRCDGEYTLTVKNAASRTVAGTDGKPVTIFYPDFSDKLRFTAHRRKGKTLLTVFNYADERLILEAAAGKKGFLFDVAPHSVAQVITSNPPPQAPLKSAVLATERRFGSPVLMESREGNASILWAAGHRGEPVLHLSNGAVSASLDVFKSLELTGIASNGREFFRKGFAGRIVFNIPKQQPVSGEVTELGIVGGVPTAKVVFNVPRYSDEDTAVNPIEKMEITRTYRVFPDAVEVASSFRNPTAKPMPLPVRLGSMPMPGVRFGDDVRRELVSGSCQGSDAADAVFLKADAASSFLPKVRNGVWPSAPVEVFARDGNLREGVIFQPDAAVTGFYTWHGVRGEFMRTVEFLLPETPLAPGESRTFTYRILLK